MNSIDADLILYNGTVVTDPGQPDDARPTAVAIKFGKTAAIGSDEELLGINCQRRIDLEGKTLLPGFISNHEHFLHDSMFRMCVDCGVENNHTISDILDSLRAKIETTPSGDWVTGFGYYDLELKEKRDPTRQELDSISPHNPVLLLQKTAHAGMVNTRALQVLGIPPDRANPGENSDEIIRDHNGCATGRLNESTLFNIGRPLLRNLFYSLDEQAQLEALEKTGYEFISRGVTTAVDAWCNPDEIYLYKRGVDLGYLKPRIVMMPYYDTCKNLLDSGVITNYSYGRIKIGPVKLFTDGSLNSRTASVSIPFSGTDKSTGLYYSQEQLDSLVAKIDGKGFQMAIHAVGDLAIEQVLNAYEKVIHNGKNEKRHRIEHLSLLTEPLLDRCADLNIVGIVIPQGIYEHGDNIVKIYGDHICRFQAYRSLLERGVRMAGHSDMPLLDADPIAAMQTAVERKTRSGFEFCPSEKIGIRDAMRLYTSNAAYAIFEEKNVGSISINKQADYVVLSRNPLDTPVSEWQEKCRVETTLVDGEVVFTAP